MKIQLEAYDGCLINANIAGTELTAPAVISHQGKFYFLKICSSSLTVKQTNDTTLQYRQCRGEFLNNIELSQVNNDEKIEVKNQC